MCLGGEYKDRTMYGQKDGLAAKSTTRRFLMGCASKEVDMDY